MKHYLTFISALLFTTFVFGFSTAFAQQNDVELILKPSAEVANNGDEIVVDIVLKNPLQQKIISVRSWLEYNPAHLEGLSLNTKDSLFTLSAPGEDAFDAKEGRVMIGRSNITGGFADVETVVATLTFKVKTAAAVSGMIKPYDYQITELGHTSVNIIEQGFPVNILTREPDALNLSFNPGAVTASTAPNGATSLSLADSNGASDSTLIRPLNLRANTGSNYVDLKWESPGDPNRLGFNVYYGKTSGQYSRRRSLDNVLSTRIDGLNNGEVYFFAVTSYDQFNQESDYSDEIGIIVNEPLSSTSPFEGVLQAALTRLPNQPQNGPLTWWILLSAIGLSGSFLFRSQKRRA